MTLFFYLYQLLYIVIASTAKAKFRALFRNCQEATYIRLTLFELNHHQLPTPVIIINTTACSIINMLKNQKVLI